MGAGGCFGALMSSLRCVTGAAEGLWVLGRGPMALYGLCRTSEGRALLRRAYGACVGSVGNGACKEHIESIRSAQQLEGAYRPCRIYSTYMAHRYLRSV